MLKRAIKDILAGIARTINDKMKVQEFLDKHSEIRGRIDALKARNEAYLTLTDLQRRMIPKPGQTTKHDLAILYLTALPAIAHNSLILKNIGDRAVDGIMKIYAQSRK